MDVSTFGRRQPLRSQLLLYFPDVGGLFELAIYLISALGFTISVDMFDGSIPVEFLWGFRSEDHISFVFFRSKHRTMPF